MGTDVTITLTATEAARLREVGDFLERSGVSPNAVLRKLAAKLPEPIAVGDTFTDQDGDTGTVLALADNNGVQVAWVRLVGYSSLYTFETSTLKRVAQ